LGAAARHLTQIRIRLGPRRFAQLSVVYLPAGSPAHSLIGQALTLAMAGPSSYGGQSQSGRSGRRSYRPAWRANQSHDHARPLRSVIDLERTVLAETAIRKLEKSKRRTESLKPFLNRSKIIGGRTRTRILDPLIKRQYLSLCNQAVKNKTSQFGAMENAIACWQSAKQKSTSIQRKKLRPDQAERGNKSRRRSPNPEDRKVQRCFTSSARVGHSAGVAPAHDFKLVL
jgi:hypothetical protein